MLSSRDDLAVILDSVANGITVQDHAGRLVYANKAAARMLGCATPGELLATPSEDFLGRFTLFDESGNPFPVERLPGRRVFVGEAEPSVTLCVRPLGNGEERWSSVRATSVKGEHGEVILAVNVWHDVTADKREDHRQTVLAEAGELLASSLDVETTLANVARLVVPRLADWCAIHLVRDGGTLAPLVVRHADEDQTAWARQLQERYPVDPDASHGVAHVLRSGRPQLTPEITDDVLVATSRDAEHLRILRQVGLRSAIIAPLRAGEHPLGTVTLVSAESGRRYDEHDLRLVNELARRAAMAIENAHLHAAEHAARRHAEDAQLRFRALFEGSPEAIVVLDERDELIDANPEACELLGYDRATLLAMQISEFAPHSGAVQTGLVPFPDMDEWRGASELRRIDGAGVPVDLWSRRLSLPTGPIRICAMRDLSAQRAADRAREEVLAAVSHDLRNPLAAIAGHVQLLRRMLRRGRMPDIERLGSRLETIDMMATRMTALLEDLVDVARLQEGEPSHATLELTDLVALVRRCARELGAASSRDITVTCSDPALVGLWNARGLERVVTNLLGNALKYSPAGETVQVQISHVQQDDGAWAELEVTDHGVGIPAGELSHVFEPYHRGSNVRHIAGTGLGLASAKDLVEAHGGAISIGSAEGNGTTVTVRLPITTTP
jgi:PAS domain S-box-containing protein